MESKFNQFVTKNKGFAVFYLIWFLIHLILISTGVRGGGTSGLWPFGSKYNTNYAYDFKDLLFWLIVPLIIWGIWKLVGKDIKKTFDDN